MLKYVYHRASIVFCLIRYKSYGAIILLSTYHLINNIKFCGDETINSMLFQNMGKF